MGRWQPWQIFLGIMSMRILFRDKHILVVDKPSGLLSTPGSLDDSVVHRLEALFPFVGVVHRLDQGTSGILIFGLNKKSQAHLSKQFQYRTTFKLYEAKVLGTLPVNHGNIQLPILLDWYNRPLQIIHPDGKPSLTHFQVIQREHNCTRLTLIPHTGRSHQLRIHLQSMGFPILGDDFYGHPEAYPMANRLNLHAKELRINHPVTEERLRFVSPTPF